MTKEEIAQWVIDNRYPKSENEKTSDFEMYHFLIAQIGIIESESESLKAEKGWISTKDNPPKDGQDVLAYQVKSDWEGNILLRWNSASFTYIEYPYYMLEPQPPKQ